MTKAALIRVSDAAIYREFTIPDDRGIRVEAPGGYTISPAYVGWSTPNGAWKIVELVRVDNRPGEFYDPGEWTRDLAGNTLTLTREWTPWTQAEIDAEIERRVDDEIDDLLRRKIGKVLFALAKDTRPALTWQQFRSWLKQQ